MNVKPRSEAAIQACRDAIALYEKAKPNLAAAWSVITTQEGVDAVEASQRELRDIIAEAFLGYTSDVNSKTHVDSIRDLDEIAKVTKRMIAYHESNHRC